jgi:hypothetical protein
MKRIELRDGQWAEARDRIDHAGDKAIKRAYVDAKADPGTIFDVQTLMCRLFVRSWHILDVDGAAIPADAPDAFDRMPADIVDTLFDEVTVIYRAATVPNAPTPPSSPDSPSAGE